MQEWVSTNSFETDYGVYLVVETRKGISMKRLAFICKRAEKRKKSPSGVYQHEQTNHISGVLAE